MKTKRMLLLFVICTLVLASCASARSAATPMPVVKGGVGNSSVAQSEAFAPAASSAPALDTSSASTASGAVTSNGIADATTNSSQQMVVKNASMTMLVDDPSKSLDDVMQLASDLGGYTVTSNRYQSYSASGEEVPAANITIRVPADKLNDALDKIKAMTGDPKKYVTDESVSGQDVTQAYTDLQSRLRNLEEASDELTKMYDKAVKAEDILAIYNQKMQVTEQIEVLKGQIKYYEDASATSSIALTINAKSTVQPVTVAGWQPTGIARDALQALINFLKGLVNFLIWVAILALPILIIIGVPLYFLIRWLVRRNKAKKARQNQVPPLPTQNK
jgi:tellurite resistance-related uncharacterized protein